MILGSHVTKEELEARGITGQDQDELLMFAAYLRDCGRAWKDLPMWRREEMLRYEKGLQ